MTSQYESHLDKALDLPGASKILADKGVNALNEELRRRGEMAKSKDKPADDKPEDKLADVDKGAGFETSVEELFLVAGEHQKGIDDISTAMKTFMDKTSNENEALQKKQAELEALAKEVQANLRDLMSDSSRRASEARETQLGKDEEQKAKDAINARTVQPSPVFGTLFGNGSAKD